MLTANRLAALLVAWVAASLALPPPAAARS